MFIEDYCLIYSCYDDAFTGTFGSLPDLIGAIFLKCWNVNSFKKQHFCKIDSGEKTIGLFTCDIILSKNIVNIYFINYRSNGTTFDSFISTISKGINSLQFPFIVNSFSINFYLK